LLRLLPAPYRLAWEEDMVATFLASTATGDVEADELTADFGRPSWPETVSVVRLAIALRIDKPGGLAWGAAIRLVALIGLLVNAVLATISVGTVMWLHGLAPWAPRADRAAAATADVWSDIVVLPLLLWIPAYLAMLDGSRRLGSVLAMLAFGCSALATVVELARGGPWVLSRSLELLLGGALVAALVAFHDDAPPVRRRPWLIAWPVGVGLLGANLLIWPQSVASWLDWMALCSLAVVVAGGVHLTTARARRNRAWSHALALLAAGVLLLRVVSIVDYAAAPRDVLAPSPLPLGVIEAVAVLAVGLALAVLAARAPRSRPASAPTHRSLSS
jgi:hypothetical protein